MQKSILKNKAALAAVLVLIALVVFLVVKLTQGAPEQSKSAEAPVSATAEANGSSEGGTENEKTTPEDNNGIVPPPPVSEEGSGDVIPPPTVVTETDESVDIVPPATVEAEKNDPVDIVPPATVEAPAAVTEEAPVVEPAATVEAVVETNDAAKTEEAPAAVTEEAPAAATEEAPAAATEEAPAAVTEEAPAAATEEAPAAATEEAPAAVTEEAPVAVTEEAPAAVTEEAPAATEEAVEEKGAMSGKTVILHSNDVHGAVEGYAYMAAQKKAFEELGADVIVVDAGDFSQGTVYVSANKGAAAIDLMNQAAYDVATLGNHEFDYGYAQLMNNLEKAAFRTVCADVVVTETGATILPATAVVEKNGLKVGFFGMETPETATKVNPALITEISFQTFDNMYASAQSAINELKETADIVIGLTHLGVDEESAANGNRSVDLWAKVEGADLFIDGHSHTVMTEGPAGEPIQSTGTAFAYIGVIVIDNETKAIEDRYLLKTNPLGEEETLPEGVKIIVPDEELPKDEETLKLAQNIEAEIDAQYSNPFAVSEVLLNGERAPGNRTEETNLGDLITDAMVWYVTKEGGIENAEPAQIVAITNGGGIRAPINVGDVTKKDINTVLPFGNTVAVIYVTGDELLEALEASTYCTPDAIGGFPQTSGMVWTINTSVPFDEGDLYVVNGKETTYRAPKSIGRVTIETVNGEPFDKAATYAVVTNNFVAAGGDTYAAFFRAYDAGSGFDTGIPMDEAVMAYIEEVLGGKITADKYGEPAGRQTIAVPAEPEAEEATEEAAEPVAEVAESVEAAVEEAAQAVQSVEAEVAEALTEVKESVEAVAEEVAEAVQSVEAEAVEAIEKAIEEAVEAAETVEAEIAKAIEETVETVEAAVEEVLAVTEEAPAATEEAVEEKGAMSGKTVILHSNDVHGAVEGYAYMAAQKKAFEELGADVIVVDAGDFSQGTVYVSANKGAAAIDLMNQAAYDVATLGNHEFDYGYAQLMNNLEKAAFRTVCADVVVTETGATILPATAVVEKNGLKVGFFGMETPETATKVNPALITEISFQTFDNMYASAQSAINELKETADIVIGLTHLGVDEESAANGNRSVDLWAKVEGADLFIDGHSHTVMTEGPAGEPIQSTGTAFAYIGVIVIDNETKAIEDRYLLKTNPLGEEETLPEGVKIIVPDEELPKDEETLKLAQNIEAEIDAQYSNPFAVSEVLLNGERAPGNRTEETNLGDLITDAMVWYVTKEGGIENAEPAQIVAITNGGGIRAPINVGDVTKKDINTVLPFGNTVAVIYVTGDELLEALEASTYCTPDAIGGFPQTSGMVWTINTSVPFDEGDLYVVNGKETTYRAPKSIGRVTIETVNGEPFDKAATYAVVTNNFVAAGGDTYAAFFRAYDAGSGFDTGIPMDEAVMAYIEEVLGGKITADKYGEPAGRQTIAVPAEPEAEEATEEAVAEEVPVEEAPVEEAPVEEAATEEAPVEEAASAEAPVAEVPVEEAPVEDAAAEVPAVDIPAAMLEALSQLLKAE